MSYGIAHLIATINDNPDPSHGDLTPSVHALVKLGVSALPSVLPLLESEDKFTRLRAQRVFERTTLAWVRNRAPGRPGNRAADYEWQKLWQDNGAYDWESPPEARAAAVASWRQWLGGSDQGQTQV